MFMGSSLSTENYSNLLTRASETFTRRRVSLDVGDTQYNSSASSSKSNLESNGWRISDGGIE